MLRRTGGMPGGRIGSAEPKAVLALMVAAAFAVAPARPAAAQQASPGVRGVWAAQRYTLADGTTHPVAGRIFFAERDWQVLFFVLDDAGAPRRGSAEGGTYTLEGDRLVFTHLFNLSAGEAMAGLPAADLRMTARDAEGAPTEPTRIEIEGDTLTLHFPSGNHMTFRRSR